jgi:MobA/MobL family
MATFHCSVKAGKSGSGGAHADYIEREGKYASKSKDDLEHKETGNLPKFAETSGEFWRAADKGEGDKKKPYREYEIALPRELTKDQRLELVREFVRQEIGDKYTYTFAIHNPKAAIEGGEQPHAHIMFSERIIDGIDRPAEQYFKRWNAKNPEKGGCKKGNNDFKTATERKAELVQLRQRFAELQNKHLAKAGHSVQVTHLSLAAQGIDREVEPHLGPKLAKELAEAVKIDRGALKTPDTPKPTPEEKQAAVELYKHFRIALETGEKDRKRAYGESVANIKAAEAATAKFRGIRDSVDTDFAKLGKRPMLLAGKWDAEKARLSAVYFAAKAEEAKAQEQKQEHTKQAEKYSAEPSVNDQVSAAFKALNLPPNAQTIERLRLGEQVFKEHQQEQAQAKAMQREQEKLQPKQERGMSR